MDPKKFIIHILKKNGMLEEPASYLADDILTFVNALPKDEESRRDILEVLTLLLDKQ